jgi:hypothetical protein
MRVTKFVGPRRLILVKRWARKALSSGSKFNLGDCFGGQYCLPYTLYIIVYTEVYNPASDNLHLVITFSVGESFHLRRENSGEQSATAWRSL